MKIECVEYLRDNFVKTSISLKYQNNEIVEAYLQDYEWGCIELKSNAIYVNKWENEDQVKVISEISKRYPCILSNGLENDKEVQSKIITNIEGIIENNKVNPTEHKIFNECLIIIKDKLGM